MRVPRGEQERCISALRAVSKVWEVAGREPPPCVFRSSELGEIYCVPAQFLFCLALRHPSAPPALAVPMRQGPGPSLCPGKRHLSCGTAQRRRSSQQQARRLAGAVVGPVRAASGGPACTQHVLIKDEGLLPAALFP